MAAATYAAGITLTDLPPEIVIAVLANVDFRTVLRCRQVRVFLNNIINRDTSMQYMVELGAASMEDGPPSSTTPSARLALLRERQSAWAQLAWRSELTLPMTQGGEYWELYGGILAQDQEGGKLAFQQLPSVIRGIKATKWDLSDAGMNISDFSSDPAQDLLVVVEDRVVGSAALCCLHLRSLHTGVSHPAAREPVLIHRTLLIAFEHTIHIAGDYVGALLSGALVGPSELLIWNWLTGERRLYMQGNHLTSYTFLSPCHILLAPFGASADPEEGLRWTERKTPRILVLDLNVVHEPAPVQLSDLEYTCEFLFPRLGPTCSAATMIIRSSPAPHWQPHPSLQVPFSVAREERLFVVLLQLDTGSQYTTISTLIPSSTFFTCLSSIPSGTTRRTFTWADWGPEGSRLHVTPVSDIWASYVYGMSFAIIETSVDGSQQTVKVLDFNQRAIRRARSSTEQEPLPQNARLVTGPTTIIGDKLFEEEVHTWLPYRATETAAFDRDQVGRIQAVMIDEDSLILVLGQFQPGRFRVLTF